MANKKPSKALRREPMSRVDTAWLRMERPTNPMMITGVLMFTEPMSLQRFKRVVEKRFLAYTRFRHKAVDTAAGVTWQEEAHFDLDWHVKPDALPGQGDGGRTPRGGAQERAVGSVDSQSASSTRQSGGGGKGGA